jgi:hydrogenase expression/formation protein HypC
MRVEQAGAVHALCRPRGGDAVAIDMRLVGAVPAGTWVLTFQDAARAVMTPEEADQVSDALEALVLIQQGQSVDHLFADLVGRAPTLPDHLRARDGRKGDA